MSTTLFALMQVCVKYLDRLPPHELVFFRGLVTLITCLIMMRFAQIHPWGNNKSVLILRGIFGTGSLTLFFYCLQNMPLGTASAIQYLSPVFTILVAGLILKEWPRAMQIFCFALAFYGAYLIKQFDHNVSGFELFLGLSAAFGSGIAYTLVRKLKNSDHPLVIVFYFSVVTVPTLGIYCLFDWVWPLGWEWGIIIAIGLLTQFAQLYMTRAFHAEKLANVTQVKYLGAAYAVIFGYFIFDEVLEPMSLVGMGLILAGVILANYFKKEDQR